MIKRFTVTTQEHYPTVSLIKWEKIDLRVRLNIKKNLLLLVTGLCIFSIVGMAGAAPVQWNSADGGNNHWYDVISGMTTWDAANTAAQTMTYDGMQGHLATLTSIEEDTEDHLTYYNY